MLRLPPVEVATPENLSEALRLLSGPPEGALPLGGGTDLLVALKHGHHAGARLVSLARLGLSGIRQGPDGWRIGAATTLWEIARWDPGGALAVVPAAARLVAAPPIRSRATLGGNLCLDTRCWFYNQSAFWRSGRAPCFKAGGEVCHVAPGGDTCHSVHQADLPPGLIALGARVEIEGPDGTRTTELAGLYSGDGCRPLALAPGELVTAAVVPSPPAGAGAAYEKLRMRHALDFAAAAAAVYLERDGDRCSAARVVLGGLGQQPIRVPEAEEALLGSGLDEGAVEAAAKASAAAARPAKNTDLTPAYRRRMAGVLVKRAAARAWEQAACAEDAR